jgi:hypothetical protein
MLQWNVLSSSLRLSQSWKNALALGPKEKQQERATRKNKNQCTNPTSHALQAQKQPHSNVKTQSTITTSKYQNKL